MTMQDNIDIVRRNFRRNMHEPELQALALKIDHERPVFIPIAIPANNGERRANRFQVERDRRLANIAKVPDLVRLAGKIDNLLRQFVMRVRQHEYLHSTRISHNGHNGHKDRYLKFRCDLSGLYARSFS